MNKLRIAILTTDTFHHRYFINQLYENALQRATLVLNLFETKPYPWNRNAQRYFKNKFPDIWQGLILNPYLQPGQMALMNTYEMNKFFPNGDTSIPGDLNTKYVHSVNDADARMALEKSSPDLIFIYGTGLVKPSTYGIANIAAINAHGGKIPGYRGLDTNLWAAYLGRPEDMMTTLHEVDEDLDTGPIYLEQSIGMPPDLNLYTLRYHTTLKTVELYLELVKQFFHSPPSPKKQNLELSRYYGPMPWLLKRKTDKILRRYVASNA